MPKRNLIWVLAVLAAAGVTLLVTRKQPTYIIQQGAKVSTDFDPVDEAYNDIRSNFYYPLDVQDLRRSALEGMISRLRAVDEYSVYLPPEKARLIQGHVMDGKEVGLGLRLEMADGQATVLGSVFESPAHRAGIGEGDQILAIDGNSVQGLPLEQVNRRLAGESGEKVLLSLLRAATGAKETLAVVRREFDVEPVAGLYRDVAGRWIYWVDPEQQIACIRVQEFVARTVQDIQTVLRCLGGAKGIVLDLRDNPGGLRQSACETVNLFLGRGAIMTEIDRAGVRTVHFAHPDTAYPYVPMVVLVNDQTASAAEIVAGALRLHDRAVLVGQRTLGKGCIQRPYSLGDMGLIYLTTAEYLVGEDQPIHRRKDADTWGVDPHVKVDLAAGVRKEVRKLQQKLQLASLPQAATRPASLPATCPSRRLADVLLAKDSQLAAAIDLLHKPADMQSLLDAAAVQRAAERAARAEKEKAAKASATQPAETPHE